MTAKAIALTVAVLGTAAAAVAGAGEATPPATPGLIAYQRYRFQDKPIQADIAVSRPDGSGQRTIASAPPGWVDDEPDWSPDGTKIVFQRCSDGEDKCTLWLANADPTVVRRLSPPLHGRAALPRCLEESSPAFSPDGASIAFECLTRPSAKRLLFSIVVMDATGAHRRVVVRGTARAGYGRPQFSPGGRQLVFEGQKLASKPKNGHATYVVSVDGSGLRRVTPWKLRAGDHPDWSPDGTRILVRSLANGPDAGHQGNLYTVRPDGTELRRLTRFAPGVEVLENGSFSPEGTQIVFATSAGATSTKRSKLPDVFVMRVDGTGLTPVTRSKNWDGSPDWGVAS